MDALDTLRKIGVTDVHSVIGRRRFPAATPADSGSRRQRSSTSTRARERMAKGARRRTPNGRLVPAVEYLQSQRVRMMMMTKLAEATAHVDVYIVASNNNGMGGPGGRGRGGRGATETPPAPQTRAPADAAQRHSNMANLASIPRSTSRTVSAKRQPDQHDVLRQPFREMEILALAKAYQDAAGFHLKTPDKIDT